MPADRRVHEALVVAQVSDDDRLIGAVDAVGADLVAQRDVRAVVLGYEQQPRGILVDAVDDARPDLPADAGEIVKMLQQRVDQRAALVAGRGMDHHARWLEHHRHVRVLIQDVQVDVLGLDRRGFGLRDADGHAVAGAQFAAGLRLLRAVDEHASLADQRPSARPRDVRSFGGEHVQPGVGLADALDRPFVHRFASSCEKKKRAKLRADQVLVRLAAFFRSARM